MRPPLSPREASCKRSEAGLAHHALEHHAAGHAGANRRGFQRLLGGFTMGRKQGGGLVGRFEIVGKRHRPTLLLRLAHRLELFTALSNELVFVNGDNDGLGLWGVELVSWCNEKRAAHPQTSA